MSHNNISLQIYISNPDYGQSCGRFWEKQKKKNKTEDSAHHYLLRYNMRRLDTHSKKKKQKTVVQSQSQCQIAFGRSFTAVSI